MFGCSRTFDFNPRITGEKFQLVMAKDNRVRQDGIPQAAEGSGGRCFCFGDWENVSSAWVFLGDGPWIRVDSCFVFVVVPSSPGLDFLPDGQW